MQSLYACIQNSSIYSSWITFHYKSAKTIDKKNYFSITVKIIKYINIQLHEIMCSMILFSIYCVQKGWVIRILRTLIYNNMRSCARNEWNFCLRVLVSVFRIFTNVHRKCVIFAKSRKRGVKYSIDRKRLWCSGFRFFKGRKLQKDTQRRTPKKTEKIIF